MIRAVEKQFVKETLTDEAKRYKRNQGFAIRKAVQFRTGNILRGRRTTVTSSGQYDGRLRIRFPAYTRFLDIKKKVKAKSGGLKTVNRRIYNRFAFGHYNQIAARLSFDLTDDVYNKIKSELNTNG